MGYSYNRLAREVSVHDLDKWRKDLRKMTQIYKSVAHAKPEEQLALFEEARVLFRTFKKNFEAWVYDELLPSRNPEKQNYLEKDVAKKVWDALLKVDPSSLFPSEYDHRVDGYRPAPHKVTQDLERNIARYQVAMNTALKSVAELLEYYGSTGKSDRLPAVEQYQIGGVTVLIKNSDRAARGESIEESIDSELSTLKRAIDRIAKAGFKKATDGLTIILQFDRTDLRAGQYEATKDELVIFPLGMGHEDNDTLTHEIGHRYYFRELPSNARAYWEETLDTRSAPIEAGDITYFMRNYVQKPDSTGYLHLDRHEMQAEIAQKESDDTLKAKLTYLAEHIPGYTMVPSEIEKHLMDEKGVKVDLEFITEYGATNPKEAFAEAFREWVLRGPRALGPWTRDFFLRITRAGGGQAKYAYGR